MPTIYASNKEELPTRHAQDFYITPKGLALATLQYIHDYYFSAVSCALDPGAGTGIWGDAFRMVPIFGYLEGLEFRDEPKPPAYDEWHIGNYMDFNPSRRYDLIMGNPPYSLLELFIDKSLALLDQGGLLVFLLKANHLETKKRYNKYYCQYQPYRPHRVLVSTRRVSFSGDGKTNADEHVIVIWRKAWSREFTTMDWLNWDYLPEDFWAR